MIYKVPVRVKEMNVCKKIKYLLVHYYHVVLITKELLVLKSIDYEVRRN